MFPSHLLTIRELSSDQIRALLSLSNRIKKNQEAYSQVLKGKAILQFFIENSTRTRMSFEYATRKLGGTNVTFAAASSSLNKGETLLDTIQTIKHFGVDAVVMRHTSGGTPALVAKVLGSPVLNAGDGQHEHPTQALLDALTLAEHWQMSFEKSLSFEGKKVMILGDILHSRVARSHIHLLTKLGAEVTLCAPLTLLPPDLSLFPKVNVIYRPDTAIPNMDAVMCLRIQYERQNGRHIPSKEEYRHFWGMTEVRAKLMKSEAVVMHPGPINRGVEIDPEVADSARSLILKQVENGIWVRMAALASLLNPEGVRA